MTEEPVQSESSAPFHCEQHGWHHTDCGPCQGAFLKAKKEEKATLAAAKVRATLTDEAMERIARAMPWYYESRPDYDAARDAIIAALV